jgi:hypothetical protein
VLHLKNNRSLQRLTLSCMDPSTAPSTRHAKPHKELRRISFMFLITHNYRNNTQQHGHTIMPVRLSWDTFSPSTSKPKTHHECCCSDCRDRLTYLQNKGGPAVPQKPNLTVKTLDNKFVVAKGKDKLYLYKLTRDSQVFNMACSCRHTFLMALVTVSFMDQVSLQSWQMLSS